MSIPAAKGNKKFVGSSGLADGLMLRIGKQSISSQLRLPQMSEVPSVDDLQFLLSRSQRNWRQEVELPWKVPESSRRFTITVKCDTITGEPAWTLYEQSEATGG